MANSTGRKSDKIMLRLPSGMRDRIKAKVDENSRSMNAEIVILLDHEYPAPTDVMHYYTDNIRRALDIYENTTDPKEQMLIQRLVESMVTSGTSLNVEFDEN